ncbi:hypothetical protein DC490_003558 [Escherichia coli]|nr:hypothetical protein [Salmonella enterica subsp. enterica serovar Typhimurium]EEZ8443664.1 hypothetical protein [Escherichia coli]EHZ1105437.1 hypothetical protein [Salmonella enterica]EHZ1105778.1 hypothetical protein [Salmonella enterica]EHZ1173126.1 hypothetical protein [Salmonella enterica]
MSTKHRCLIVLMMTFSLVNVAFAKNELPYRVVVMNDIADDGNQNVKFINKKGGCYYFGQALLVSVQNAKIFGVEIPDAPKSKAWDFIVKSKVCQGGDRDKTPYSVKQTLYLAPDTKTIQRKTDSVLIPAGTEFLAFPSEEERKKYFDK